MRGTISLESRILEFMRKYREMYPEQWVNGGQLERLAMDVGYKGSTASRQCRLLVEKGKLERNEYNGSVWYRYNS